MPWEVPENYVVKIGGNYFANCGRLITYDDKPLFDLKRRASDGRLGIDFDVYDKDGAKVATIRNGNVVDGNKEAYLVSHGANCHSIIEKATGRVICQIDKHPKEPHVELDVSVQMFTPDGFLLEAYPDRINVGGATMIRELMQGYKTGIAIGNCSGGAGIALPKPQNVG